MRSFSKGKALALLTLCLSGVPSARAAVHNIDQAVYVHQGTRVLTPAFYTLVETLADGDELYFRGGSGTDDKLYYLTQPLIIRDKSNIVLRGDVSTSVGAKPDTTLQYDTAGLMYKDPTPTATLTIHDDFYNNLGTTGKVVVGFVKSTGIRFEHLALHGRAQCNAARENPTTGNLGAAMGGILVSGSSYCEIKDCVIKELGGRKPKTRKGFHIAVVATETGGELRPAFAQAPPSSQPYAVPNVDCLGNKITNCLFEDMNDVTSFGVRLKTNWLLAPEVDLGVQVAHTVVEYCTFAGNEANRGGFNQNAIEVGGPATVNNTVRNNIFLHTRFAPLECDKGSKDNNMLSNLIDGVYPLNGVSANPKNPTKFNGRWVVGMRDGGWPAAGHFGERNSFKYNTIRNLNGISIRTGGMALQDSKNASVAFNTIGSGVDAEVFVYDDSPPSFFLINREVHDLASWGQTIGESQTATEWHYYRRVPDTTDPVLSKIDSISGDYSKLLHLWSATDMELVNPLQLPRHAPELLLNLKPIDPAPGGGGSMIP